MFSYLSLLLSFWPGVKTISHQLTTWCMVLKTKCLKLVLIVWSPISNNSKRTIFQFLFLLYWSSYHDTLVHTIFRKKKLSWGRNEKKIFTLKFLWRKNHCYWISEKLSSNYFVFCESLSSEILWKFITKTFERFLTSRKFLSVKRHQKVYQKNWLWHCCVET